jgi:DNA mismatch endonuclease (patch repair protein)
MADVFTPEQRSANMSRIRGKDTKPELLVRRMLHARGFRYRLHGSAAGAVLPGKPDLVFAGRRKVIFVNGCFWHRHDCKAGRHEPGSNADFWRAKRARTAERDAAANAALHQAGWDVLTVWECELKKAADLPVLEERLLAFLGGTGAPGRAPEDGRRQAS